MTSGSVQRRRWRGNGGKEAGRRGSSGGLIVTSVLDLEGDSESLHYRFRRELRENGTLIRERSWVRRYPRDGH